MTDDPKADFQFFDPKLAEAMRETLESIAKHQPCTRKCNCKNPDTCCIMLRQFCSKCLAQQTLNMVAEQSSA